MRRNRQVSLHRMTCARQWLLEASCEVSQNVSCITILRNSMVPHKIMVETSRQSRRKEIRQDMNDHEYTRLGFVESVQ